MELKMSDLNIFTHGKEKQDGKLKYSLNFHMFCPNDIDIFSGFNNWRSTNIDHWGHEVYDYKRIFYRAYVSNVSAVDYRPAFGLDRYISPYDSIYDLTYTKYISVKATEKGNWVIPLEYYDIYNHLVGNGSTLQTIRSEKRFTVRWVSNSSRKRFCHDTIEGASEGLYYRLKKMLQYVEHDYQMCIARLNNKCFDNIRMKEQFKNLT